MAQRDTSAAKGVQLDSYAQSFLSAEQDMSAKFNNQNEAKNENAQQAEATQDDGSKMVKEDSAQNDMRPPPEIANAQDRETFNDKWKAEQQKSAQSKEDYAQSYLDTYGSESQNAQDRSRDNGNDFSR